MSSIPPLMPLVQPFDWDDSPYRDDYRDRYGTDIGYEDYDTAYRYGHQLGNDARYRGLEWEAAEPELRSSWEGNHPDSPWDKFKDSIRHAWDRIRG